MNALTIIFAVIAFLFFCAYLQMKRERDTFKFDFMHLNLETIIEKWPVTKTSMIKILSYFKDLKACRWTDTEKVDVLWGTFCEKYNELRKFKEDDEFEVKDGDLDEISQTHNALRDSQRFD